MDYGLSIIILFAAMILMPNQITGFIVKKVWCRLSLIFPMEGSVVGAR